MAIAFRAASTVATHTTTSAPFTAPAGTVSTDVLIAWVAWDNSGGATITAPSGWTQIDTQVAAGTLGVWCGWALGSVASLTWTFSVSCVNFGDMLGYSGVDNTTPIAAHSLNLAAANPISTTSITVPANDWFLTFVAAYSGGSVPYTTPTGLTSRATTAATASADSNAADPGSITASWNASGGTGGVNVGAEAIALAQAGGTTFNQGLTAASATPVASVQKAVGATRTASSTAGVATIAASHIQGQILSAASTAGVAHIATTFIPFSQSNPPTDLFRQEYSNNSPSYSAYSDVFREVSDKTSPNPQEDSWVIRVREFYRRFF